MKRAGAPLHLKPSSAKAHEIFDSKAGGIKKLFWGRPR